ncbi:MAG: M36 family metallopeptidase, partial [Verrucomicrobiota bacterium]
MAFLGLLLGCAAPCAVAQVAPASGPLPNVDKRVDGQNRPALIAGKKQEALASLRDRAPELEADIDPVLKSPTFISSAKGFLTGPDGAGGIISANAAKAIPENDPHRSIKAFLNEEAAIFGHGAEVLTGARINREFVSAHSGLKTTIWQQQVDGIPVYEALLIGHVTKKGELVNLSTRLLADPAKAVDAGTAHRLAAQNAPAVSAPEAIVNAARDIGNDLAVSQVKEVGEPEGVIKRQRFKASPVLNGDSFAELVWLPMSDSSLRLCWQVLLTSRARGEMFKSLVDAQTGEVMIRNGLTEYVSDATYNVYTSDSPSPFSPGLLNTGTTQPPLVPRVLVTTNAVSLEASPNGWINDGDTETSGNNVDAHLDRNDDNQPDLPRPNGTASRNFNFALDLTQEPTTYGDAAVVQLFYWNNWYHDKVYELGFTEAAGNFQQDNFGRGGAGNDPVQADAQDGLDLLDSFHDNNANMSTPPDGFSPRMQMYKFSGGSPDRDGDLDAEVILHEHTHGLSNRRVGGGAGLFNLQSRGMGEGWSDFYALSLLSADSDNVNGNYASGGYVTFNLFGLTANYYFGIRRYPYSTDLNKNPLTFKDIDPGQASTHAGIPVSPLFGGSPADEVHAQGEVWCSMLWEARAAMINKYGPAIGNQLILQLVTDGMNLTPPNPNFIQARDGILMADRVNSAGANRLELFAAFAKRGLGALAGSPSSSTTAGVIESFDVPGLAYNSITVSGGNDNGLIEFNECNNLQIVFTNIGVSAGNISVTLTTTTPEVIIAKSVSGYPDIPAGGSGENFSPFRISTSSSFICGTPVDLALIIKSDVDTRTNRFRVATGVLGAAVRFNNNSSVPIPDASPAGATSPIVVSNFGGTIGKVTVALYLTHTFDADLLIQLISPKGTVVTLSQNNGAAGDNFGTSCNSDNLRTRFDDSALLPISSGTAPFVGSFQPEQPLSTFNLTSGTDANGTWKLKVIDQGEIDVGSIQCWSLFLSPQTCSDGGGECPGSDLGVTMVANPDPAVTATNLTYTLTVTNHGPSSAKTVVLSHELPSGSIFVSATNSQGNVQQSGGIVTFNFGKIAARGSATASVVVIPTAVGTISSTATVGSEQTDPDLSNNSATVFTRVVLPSADLALAILDSPDPVTAGGALTYTINITNHGPISASGVMLTNTLPSTAAFVSAVSTQGSFVNAGGTIIYNLGNIPSGGGAVVTIVVRPTVIGTIVATSRVAASQSDSAPGNNVATAITTV